MHYKNGRVAKNGDKVVIVTTGQSGILYNAVAGNDYCNGRLAQMRNDDPCPNLKECLHLDDVAAAGVPDSTQAQLSVLNTQGEAAAVPATTETVATEAPPAAT
jgi:hypothetical protein